MVTLKIRTADGQTQIVSATTYGQAWDIVQTIDAAVRAVDDLGTKYVRIADGWCSL